MTTVIVVFYMDMFREIMDYIPAERFLALPLVAAVKEAIAGAIDTTDEKITDVLFDGSELTVKVDLSDTDTRFSLGFLAECRVSTITDEILKLDDNYYNTWEAITLDFGDIGSISYDKSDVRNAGFGKYFDVPMDLFSEKADRE